MKSIELFAGIGGISLAAEWAGIETVAFCEIDDYAGKVLKKNWPDVPLFKDIKHLNRKTLEGGKVIEPGGTVELISGGFPCQPYSLAGKRKGKEDDRDLWPEMFRIIQEIKPTWVVGENVANFVNMELERTLSDLENEGYETQSFLIPACAVNAKHQRFRTFIVAYSDSFGRNNREYNKRTRHLQNELNRDNPQGEQKRDGWINRLGEIRSVLSGSASEGMQRNSENGSSLQSSEWKVEPKLGRMADGVPFQLDRIRTLGNAVVPQQIYPIFKAIADIETEVSDGIQ